MFVWEAEASRVICDHHPVEVSFEVKASNSFAPQRAFCRILLLAIEKANFINAAALFSAISSLIMGFSRRGCIQIFRFGADE